MLTAKALKLGGTHDEVMKTAYEHTLRSPETSSSGLGSDCWHNVALLCSSQAIFSVKIHGINILITMAPLLSGF